MFLYDFTPAPGPRKVRMFAAEKGIDLELKQVNLREREHFSDWFRAINPECTVPVLVPDEGEPICSAMPICYYLDALYPEPYILGRTPLERAHAVMWNMRMENGYAAGAQMLRNTNPFFENRAVSGPDPVPQIPALGERAAKTLELFYERLNQRLADSQHIGGDDFGMADITAFCAIDFAKRFEHEVPEGLGNVLRWYDQVATRPSAAA